MKDYKNNYVNGLEFAGYYFDVFECEDGSVGFTVYEKGIKPNDDCKAVDIYVNENMEVNSI